MELTGVRVVVIVLASTSDPVERVRALDRGADDVVGRPFAYNELLARIRALIRRTTGASEDVIVAGDLVVDRPTRRVHVRETPVFLSAKEFELVAKLASQPYRVWTKEELLRDVWGFGLSVVPGRWNRTRRACGRSSASARMIGSSSTSGASATGCSTDRSRGQRTTP